MQYWQNAEELELHQMAKVFVQPKATILNEFCGIYLVGIGVQGIGVSDPLDPEHEVRGQWRFELDLRWYEHNPFAKNLHSDYPKCRYIHEFGMVPLYIGMTTRPFKQRIKEHHVVWPLVEMPWIAFKCWPFPIGTPKEYLMELEAVLINKFNPPLNKVRPTVCWGSDKTLFLPAVE